MLEATPLRFGILERYVTFEVLRSFILALLTITAIVVLFMVMAEAVRAGLAPIDILRLIPFLIPSSLPYTMPVALLFAVTVVYGRLAADNEIIAVKTAGLSVMTMLKPSFLLGLGLSAVLWRGSQEEIPWATREAKKIVFNNVEDYFYKVLKKERQFDNANWPFYIKVKDVEERKMIGPIFKHRAGGPENPNQFDLKIVARTATVNWDLDHNVVRVFLIDAETTGSSDHPDFIYFENNMLEIPIPDTSRFNLEPKTQELTFTQMIAKQNELTKLLSNERKRQAIAAAMWIGSGRINRVDWPHFQAAFGDYLRWNREYKALETEKQMRTALAFGSLFFVLVGAPVGVFFGRRDFLSAFISCFLPIIAIYYPLTLAGVNVSKEGLVDPVIALHAGNLVLGLGAAYVLRKVMKN
ncbi:MAG TPA: LptF/LptG family permease [Isosphaeraceae bacterium]|nr:LptF/LptG family permease [Isosphaeraceae bacterium]